MIRARKTLVGTTSRNPVRSSADWRDPLVWIISIFVVLDFTYAITFNLLPDGLRLNFIGVLFVGQAGLGLLSLTMRIDPFRLKMALVVFLMLTVWLATSAVFGSTFAPEAALRRMAPVLAALMFIGFADRLPVRLITYCACFTIAFAILWAGVQPAYFHGWQSDLARFAPFHGGAAEDGDNAHASSYIILSCVLIIHQALLTGYFYRRSFLWLFIVLGAILIGGYWSTQVQLSLVAYFAAHLLMARRVSMFLKVLATVVFIVGVGGLLLEKEIRNVESAGFATYDTSTAGTGRIGTWMDRIERIKSREAGRNIIGDGILTDFYTSRTWDKYTHSHNSALTYMMESGVIGTVVFFSILLLPLTYFGRSYAPIFILVLAGSLVDSGITHRGMAYMLFWFAVGILALRIKYVQQPKIRPAIASRPVGYAPVTTRNVSA